MTDNEKFAYMAGLIDGEGTIAIRKYKQHNRSTFQYKPIVVVSNTDDCLMDWLVAEFGDR